MVLWLVEPFVSMCVEIIAPRLEWVCREVIAVEEREGGHDSGNGSPMFGGETNGISPSLLSFVDILVEEVV